MKYKYSIAFLDMDDTLLSANSWEIIKRMSGNGKEHFSEYMSGEISYAELLAKSFGNKPVCYDDVVKQAESARLHAGAEALVSAQKSLGIKPVIVTAGLCEFARAVADKLEISEYYCNGLEYANGCATGKIHVEVEPLKKMSLIEKIISLKGIPWHEVIIVGDAPFDFDPRAGLNIMLETERYGSWEPPEWVVRVRSLASAVFII
jgi:HAD superfamily phosphoserine phosphatase-like hydrolase